MTTMGPASTATSGATSQAEGESTSGTVTSSPTSEGPTGSETDSGGTTGSNSTTTTETETGDSSTGFPDLPADNVCDGLVTHEGGITAYSLADLEVLEGVECLNGGLGFTLYEDSYIDYIQELQIINGPLTFVESGDLTEPQGFDSLHTVTSTLSISLTNFQTLSGFNNVEYVHGLYIEDNFSLYTLEGLNSLTTIEESLIIGLPVSSGNPMLTTIDALSNLQWVGGEFFLHDSGVSSLEPLELMEVGSNLEISNNHQLPTCLALAFAESKGVSYWLENNKPDECGG